jgi:hypothetical protein
MSAPPSARALGDFAEGYTSGNLRIMVDKGLLDMDDLVEVWQSPLIPNGPLMVSNKLPADMKDKVTALLQVGLPEADFECFDSLHRWWLHRLRSTPTSRCTRPSSTPVSRLSVANC